MISFHRNFSCCYCCCYSFFHQLNGTNVLIFIILQRMKATKCPSDEISLTNKVAVNPTDFPEDVEYAIFFMQIVFSIFLFFNFIANFNGRFVLLFKDIYACQPDLVNILCFQSFEHPNVPKTMLASRWYRENGRQFPSIKTST